MAGADEQGHHRGCVVGGGLVADHAPDVAIGRLAREDVAGGERRGGRQTQDGDFQDLTHIHVTRSGTGFDSFKFVDVGNTMNTNK